MARRTSSTKRTASAAMAVPGVIVYADGAATAAVCDADSSAAATVALRPLGALAQSVASGDEVEILTGPGCTLVATGAVQEGDLLICVDGGAGYVTPLTASTADTLLADGDPVYVVGIAEQTTTAAGAVLANVAPYFYERREA